MTRVKTDRKSNALADKIAGFNDPSMGDERERDIILRAYTYGSVLTTLVIFAIAIVFAVIGAGFWSILLMGAAVVGGIAISRYCKREGIDFSMITAQIDKKRFFAGQLLSVLFLAGWLFAIAFHISTGHPLVDVNLGSQFNDSDAASDTVMGGVSGFAAATVAGLVMRNIRRKQARAQLFLDDED